eukprot:gene4130-2973_t
MIKKKTLKWCEILQRKKEKFIMNTNNDLHHIIKEIIIISPLNNFKFAIRVVIIERILTIINSLNKPSLLFIVYKAFKSLMLKVFRDNLNLFHYPVLGASTLSEGNEEAAWEAAEELD